MIPRCDCMLLSCTSSVGGDEVEELVRLRLHPPVFVLSISAAGSDPLELRLMLDLHLVQCRAAGEANHSRLSL